MFKLFEIKDFDGHYDCRILGIKISIRHKCKYNYTPTTEYGITTEKRTPQLIVSLTSFPARINAVHFAINTILNQNLKPDRVILWLADSQFPNKEKDLPDKIIRLKELGLEIKWCEDIKSYKKLIPALREFPEDIIITADDDIYYEKDWLESLYKTFLNNPECIICQRPRRLKLKNDRIVVMTSHKSENIDLTKPDYFNQMLGGGGVLYPPHSLYKDIFNTEKLMQLLPTNDDIWFWAMAVLNKTKIGVAKGWSGNLYQLDLWDSSLCKINSNLEKQKDKDPFKIICREYGHILEIIK